MFDYNSNNNEKKNTEEQTRTQSASQWSINWKEKKNESLYTLYWFIAKIVQHRIVIVFDFQFPTEIMAIEDQSIS